MPTRTISKLISTTAAVSALGLAASGSALAVPADGGCACGGARVPETTTASRPIPSPPTWPENPQPLPPPQTVATADAGFQWDDAGIGAALAVVVLAGLGGAFVLRRRREADPPLPA